VGQDPRIFSASEDVATLPGGPVSRPSEAAYTAGDLVGGKYELVRPIGEGGMGLIWEAENVHLQIPVALKLVRASMRQGIALERLAVEARAAAQVVHPAIVRILDFGVTTQRDPFIAMELLSGESLREVMSRGRMEEERAARLALRLADGLVAAHARGIVHRDVKPENVLLAQQPRGGVQPKLIDFGVAKMLHRDAHAPHTMAGVIVGSPDYMAPEQVRGESIGPAVDVWALCVLLYELLAGHRPFRGPTVQHVLRAILKDMAAPIPNVDPALMNIIGVGLSRDPQARWASMAELAEALSAWLSMRGLEDDGTSPLRASWWPDDGGNVPAAMSSSLRPLSVTRQSMRGTPPPPVKRGAPWGVTIALTVSALVIGVVAGRLGRGAAPASAPDGGVPVAAPSPMPSASVSAAASARRPP